MPLVVTRSNEFQISNTESGKEPTIFSSYGACDDRDAMKSILEIRFLMKELRTYVVQC
jgi:hypothetical protein